MKAENVAASYANAIIESGELVRLVRAGDPRVYQARARIIDATTEEMAGGVQQERRQAIVLGADVVKSGFPLPFQPNEDRIIWDNGSTTNAIIRDGARKIGTTVIAYMLDIEG